MGKEREVDLSQPDQLMLGSRVRLVRHSRGVRLSEMARGVGYDRGYLSHVEQGHVRPSEELVGKIAGYFSMGVEELKEKDIFQLINTETLEQQATALPVEPSYTSQTRTAGQRVDRILAMGHLSKEDEDIVADKIAAITRELVNLAKGISRRQEAQGAIDPTLPPAN